MTQWFTIISFLALSWSATALAQEPAGFAGFAWGSPRVVVSNELVKDHCPWHITYTTLRGYQRVVCNGYLLSPLGPVYVTFDFVGEVLTGYEVAVPRQLGSALRAAVPSVLATPARPVPGMNRGTWKTSVSISEVMCLPGSVCLTVTASQAPTAGERETTEIRSVTDPKHPIGDRARGGKPPSAVTIAPSAEPGGRPGMAR